MNMRWLNTSFDNIFSLFLSLLFLECGSFASSLQPHSNTHLICVSKLKFYVFISRYRCDLIIQFFSL